MSIDKRLNSTIGAKLVSGRFKPKFGLLAIFRLLLFLMLLLGSLYLFVIGIVGIKIEYIIESSIGIFAVSYWMLIEPYLQNPKNYQIIFKSDNSLENFKLFYKGKEVTVKCKIDNDGKITFLNDKSKKSCISYADGSKMKSITKFRIINYFTKWLSDNKLLSKEVTATFE